MSTAPTNGHDPDDEFGDDDFTDNVTDIPGAPGVEATPDTDGVTTDGGPQTLYPSVAEWVADFLAVAYAREVRVNGAHRHWCSQWWRHPEALDRLEALWRAWEALRRDPTTGPATWWKDYADPLMTVLLSRDGPFGQCRGARHAPPQLIVQPLPVDDHDPALFPPGN